MSQKDNWTKEERWLPTELLPISGSIPQRWDKEPRVMQLYPVFWPDGANEPRMSNRPNEEKYTINVPAEMVGKNYVVALEQTGKGVLVKGIHDPNQPIGGVSVEALRAIQAIIPYSRMQLPLPGSRYFMDGGKALHRTQQLARLMLTNPIEFNQRGYTVNDITTGLAETSYNFSSGVQSWLDMGRVKSIPLSRSSLENVRETLKAFNQRNWPRVAQGLVAIFLHPGLGLDKEFPEQVYRSGDRRMFIVDPRLRTTANEPYGRMIVWDANNPQLRQITPQQRIGETQNYSFKYNIEGVTVESGNGGTSYIRSLNPVDVFKKNQGKRLQEQRLQQQNQQSNNTIMNEPSTAIVSNVEAEQIRLVREQEQQEEERLREQERQRRRQEKIEAKRRLAQKNNEPQESPLHPFAALLPTIGTVMLSSRIQGLQCNDLPQNGINNPVTEANQNSSVIATSPKDEISSLELGELR